MSRVSKAHHCRSSAGSLDASRLIKGQRVGGSSIAGPNEAMVCLLTSTNLKPPAIASTIHDEGNGGNPRALTIARRFASTSNALA